MDLCRPVSLLDQRPITTAQIRVRLMATPCARLPAPLRRGDCFPMIFRLERVMNYEVG